MQNKVEVGVESLAESKSQWKMTKAELEMVMDVFGVCVWGGFPISPLRFNNSFWNGCYCKYTHMRQRAHANGADKHKFYPTRKAPKAEKHEKFAWFA